MLAKTLSGENGQGIGVQVKPVRVGKLANVLGKTLKVITVKTMHRVTNQASNVTPEVSSPMCSRAIRSENLASELVKVCKAGDNFFGLPGS